ncbi:DUF885 domain-containing protein [Photobacterium lipolyticum]|uniref:DUF885 domain-containing protein n=1 Tax=Photobacterium lipolyticum TaxID=266810 RepID=A0A2T3MWW3_9GAMM|nr:DUF885 domain-containing protein [Photobacterium lipolyticum]PSW04460.1 DUF885 domain-containing protein [Photobacterium lipolyticum]
MKSGFLRLNAAAAAVFATVSLGGCNDETTTITSHSSPTPPPITAPEINPAIEMRKIFADYQAASKNLDSSPFGQMTDQMASSLQSLDRMYLDKLEALDRDKLSDEDKIYFDTFLFDRNITIRGGTLPNARFGSFDIPITHFYNYVKWYASEAGDTQTSSQAYQDHLQTVRDYTSWVNNLHSQYLMGEVERIQLSKVLIDRYVNSTEESVAKDNYAMLKSGISDIQTHSDQYDAAFIAEYNTAVDDAIAATSDLVAYLKGDYNTAARGTGALTDTNIGWGHLPNGQAWYQWHLDRNSTTGKSATELSKLGEQLVADAKAEMERVALVIVDKHGKTITEKWRDKDQKVIDRTFELVDADGKIVLNEFFAYLNSEKFFYGRDGRNISGTPYDESCGNASIPSACEAALEDYYKFKNDANGVVAQYFKPIKTDYSIVPIPADGELYEGVGSYGGNEFNLNTNPNYSLQKWNVSTLLLHEAAPGHHFQNAYSIEYPPADKPNYIKNVWYTAYAEGWALYTEWLGLEMNIYGELDEAGKPTFKNATGMCKTDLDYNEFQGGIYTDMEECNALQYFGSLNEAQLRNMRLAVDTGIHAKGWSIQQARDYMRANSALGDGDIESESFRYAAYVGQAVSYKSGYLVIREMLEKAQTELGNQFDWAAFHDQLLKYGDQPMEVVQTSIENWIETQK